MGIAIVVLWGCYLIKCETIPMRFVEGESLFKIKALSHFGETQHMLINSFIYSTSILGH